MLGFFNTPKPEVLHHWFSMAEGFQVSSADFYAAIEKALRDRQVPGLDIARVDFAEGGLLSAKREYLRLTRERMYFDICAAPFGTGCFFSSRFAEMPLVVSLWEVFALLVGMFVTFCLFLNFLGFTQGIFAMLAASAFALYVLRNAVALGLRDIDAMLLKSPVIGAIYAKYLRKETYYRHDTRLMYLETVPGIVKAIADEMTAAKGVKLLRQYETSPILGDLYRPVPPEPKPEK